MFADETSFYSVYTRRVTPESIDADSVKICPVFLQEEITSRDEMYWHSP
jgi:hypothetical protein